MSYKRIQDTLFVSHSHTSPKELASRNFLLVSQGIDPDESIFHERLQRELKDYYTALRADTKHIEVSKGASLQTSTDFEKEYIQSI